MATASERITPIEVKDPRTILKTHRLQPILKSGSQITYQNYAANSVDNSSITFQCNPPSGNVIVDRKVYVSVPVRLVINCVTSTTNNVNSTALQAACDALRSFPLSKSIQTLSVTVNNQTLTTPLADIIDPLQHYNVDWKLKQADYSMTPNMYDSAANYNDLYGGINNPLNLYQDGKEYAPESRGAFPINIILNTQSNVANTAVQAIVDFVVTEPLFISPLYFGQKNSSGFYNVSSMSVTLTMANNSGYRMWSHCNQDGALNGTNITSINTYLSNFTSANAQAFSYQDKPTILFTYITPQDTMKLSPFESLSYPYFKIQDFPTDGSATAYGAITSVINSNNMNLSSIPRRVFIFARPSNNTLYSPDGASLPDCYFSLETVNISFNNQNNILSGVTKQQLYNLSIKNGCDMSWTEWSGGPTQNSANFGVLAQGSHPGNVFTMGSVLCLEFGSDIPLSSVTDAPGKVGNYNFQVQATFKNLFKNTNFAVPGASRVTVPTLHIVVVSEGTFTIDKLGVASVHVGDITTTDILEARPFNEDAYDYYDMQDPNGGNFLDGLKDAWRGIRKGFMMPMNALKEVGNFVKPIASITGLMGSGIHSGGEMASYSDLKNRLSHY